MLIALLIMVKTTKMKFFNDHFRGLELSGVLSELGGFEICVKTKRRGLVD